jgi:hypothetical protein
VAAPALRRRLQFLLRTFSGIAAAIAATGVYARGWGAGQSLALGAAVAVAGYASLWIVLRSQLGANRAEPKPSAPSDIGPRSRATPRRGRRVLTGPESDDGEAPG